MKAYLLHPGQDFDFERPLPWNAEAISEDLALSPLLAAMGKGDQFVREVARKVILSGFDNNLDTIRHRLDILDDCLKQPEAVRELYAIALEAVEKQRKHYLGALAHYPDWVLRLSLELIESLLDTVRKLREMADAQSHRFVSDGWTRFFTMVKEELNDNYFAEVRYHLAQLKFRKGVCISARLGKANKGSDYVLRRPPVEEGTWLTRLLNWQRPPYSFSLHPRDEGGARALSELQDRGISLVARAVAQSADHISSFFSMLRTELAFYIGCVNLHEELAGKGEPTCLPTPEPADEGKLSFQDLYNASLALSLDGSTVGNDVNADRQVLIMITGANQGGKSTFLRSVGLAQLMMQSGMFVAARSFTSSVCDGLFTHYKREEDTGMKSGKLDEELGRMSEIIDHLTHHPMVLFNESFAATNEREGSEIATQILSALSDRSVRMICVTHLYELSRGFYQKKRKDILFLRAERNPDGARTFKLRQAEPLQTSFGEDLYRGIFGAEPPRKSSAQERAEIRL